jgi:hypothetical protein
VLAFGLVVSYAELNSALNGDNLKGVINQKGRCRTKY